MRLLCLLAATAVAGGCIYQDECVGGAIRVDGRCRLVDGGAATDAQMDASSLPDAALDAAADTGTGRDATADAAVLDAGCEPVSEACNGADDDCDGVVDEGLIGPLGFPDRIIEEELSNDTIAGISLGEHYVVAYSRADDQRAYWLELDADGAISSGPTAVATSSRAQRSIALHAIDDTSFVAVWSEATGGTWDVIRARVLTAGGASGPAVEVVSNAAPTAAPGVAVAAGRIIRYGRTRRTASGGAPST